MYTNKRMHTEEQQCGLADSPIFNVCVILANRITINAPVFFVFLGVWQLEFTRQTRLRLVSMWRLTVKPTSWWWRTRPSCQKSCRSGAPLVSVSITTSVYPGRKRDGETLIMSTLSFLTSGEGSAASPESHCPV